MHGCLHGQCTGACVVSAWVPVWPVHVMGTARNKYVLSTCLMYTIWVLNLYYISMMSTTLPLHMRGVYYTIRERDVEM